ncbi:MAG: ABC transporter permease [Labilibaculum sp.]|nr:ABC transporter permease [Labilibaculum sp.]
MNLYNIKLSVKNLLKNKLVTSINIAGLALGIAISLLIFSFVHKENTIDKFIPNIDHVFTILNYEDPDISAKMVEHIRQEIPEISHITYAQHEWSPQVFLEYNNVNFKIENLLVADSGFFKVFQFEAVYGNPATALYNTNQIVLTESIARKIFGNENPIGKTVKYNATNLQNEILKIGAVIKDLPHNCSWNFEAVLSSQTNYKISWYINNIKYWGTQNYAAFFSIPENVDIEYVREKLHNISLNNVPDDSKNNIKYDFLPFTNCYCDLPELTIIKHGNHLTLTIIQIVGFLILFLACINYINLVTAQKLNRLRNIGILKVLGSKRRKIIELISTESLLVLLFTTFIIFILTDFLLSGLNHFTNSRFTLSDIYSGWNLAIFLSILFFTFLATGLLPGITLSKNQASLLLKNSSTYNKYYLRNSLLVFQFTISIILIISVLFINKQNTYLSNLDPGFKKENIIYTNTNDQLIENIDAFKHELRKIPGVEELTFSSALLGYNQANWGRMMINKGKEQAVGFANFFVSPNFFNFFGIELIRGIQFNDYSFKSGDWIMNQSAIKKFNIDQLEDAKLLNFNGTKNEDIIAEIKDFNFESMHVPIRPVGFRSAGDADQVAYIKLNTKNSRAFDQSIIAFKNLWEKLSPKFPLEIKFMDASWEALYKKEKQFQSILNFATIISILLSCLGLISLTFFLVETHTKEIGIRKVNGAKTFEIVKLLNNDIIKWVAIAFVIACPIAWYAMNKWLENFAYKTELSWWIFALAGVIAMGIALLTVSFQSWRAASRNPVESLRYE